MFRNGKGWVCRLSLHYRSRVVVGGMDGQACQERGAGSRVLYLVIDSPMHHLVRFSETLPFITQANQRSGTANPVHSSRTGNRGRAQLATGYGSTQRDRKGKHKVGKIKPNSASAAGMDAQNLKPPVRSMTRWGSYRFLIFRSLCTFLPYICSSGVPYSA